MSSKAMIDASEEAFFAFVGEYRDLIHKHIPGQYHMEYDSRLYMMAVYRHLQRVVAGLPAGAKLLDLGCGRGHYTAYLSRRGLQVTGVEVKEPAPGDDFLQNQMQRCIETYPALWADSKELYGGECGYFDGKNLEFPDASFDGVLFYATFEHVPVPDLPHMLDEVFRVLKPGGRFFIYHCPTRFSWSEHVAGWLKMGRHTKLYGKGEALGLLKRAGLEVTYFSRSDFFPVHVVPIQGLVNAMARPILAVESVLKWTPLAYIYHDFVIEGRKP